MEEILKALKTLPKEYLQVIILELMKSEKPVVMKMKCGMDYSMIALSLDLKKQGEKNLENYKSTLSNYDEAEK